MTDVMEAGEAGLDITIAHRSRREEKAAAREAEWNALAAKNDSYLIPAAKGELTPVEYAPSSTEPYALPSTRIPWQEILTEKEKLQLKFGLYGAVLWIPASIAAPLGGSIDGIAALHHAIPGDLSASLGLTATTVSLLSWAGMRAFNRHHTRKAVIQNHTHELSRKRVLKWVEEAYGLELPEDCAVYAEGDYRYQSDYAAYLKNVYVGTKTVRIDHDFKTIYSLEASPRSSGGVLYTLYQGYKTEGIIIPPLHEMAPPPPVKRRKATIQNPTSILPAEGVALHERAHALIAALPSDLAVEQNHVAERSRKAMTDMDSLLVRTAAIMDENPNEARDAHVMWFVLSVAWYPISKSFIRTSPRMSPEKRQSLPTTSRTE